MAGKKKKTKSKEIDVDQTLLKKRTLFFIDIVKSKSSKDIIKELYALDEVNHKEITLYVNSYGGCIEDGFGIIDAIQRTKSKVHTIISGAAFSMGSLISIVGNKRSMTKNSVWMTHPGSEYVEDYFGFIKDRVKALKILDKITDNLYRQNTNLTDKEISFAKRGEIWLSPKECLDKGIVDKII